MHVDFFSHNTGLSNGKELRLNLLLPCAASLAGIGSTAMLDFLACLGVDTLTEQHMRGMFVVKFFWGFASFSRN